MHLAWSIMQEQAASDERGQKITTKHLSNARLSPTCPLGDPKILNGRMMEQWNDRTVENHSKS